MPYQLKIKAEQFAHMQKLITALRSGKFKQISGRLAALRTPVYNTYETRIDPVEVTPENADFCCLGVACYISKEDTKHDWRFNSSTKEVTYGEAKEVNGGLLPESVSKWLGTSHNPMLYLGEPDGIQMATYANDGLQLPFEQIADAFERTYILDDGVDAEPAEG